MIRAATESPADVVRWLHSEAADLWPAILGSLSFRRSRCGVRLDLLLEAISKFLDSQHEMIERVRRDLVRGLKKPRNGRRD